MDPASELAVLGGPRRVIFAANDLLQVPVESAHALRQFHCDLLENLRFRLVGLKRAGCNSRGSGSDQLRSYLRGYFIERSRNLVEDPGCSRLRGSTIHPHGEGTRV